MVTVTEQGHITFSKSTPKGKGLALLDRIKGDPKLLLEFWCCIWHKDHHS